MSPPRSWEETFCSVLDEEFISLFLGVAQRFPQDAVQMLSLLIGDEKARPKAEDFLRALTHHVFEQFEPS